MRALALALQRPIHVYSADSPVVVIGEDIRVSVAGSLHSREFLCTSPTTRSTSLWAIITIHSFLFFHDVCV